MSPEAQNRSSDFRIQSPLDVHLIHHWAIILNTGLLGVVNLMGQEYLEMPAEDGLYDYDEDSIAVPATHNSSVPLSEPRARSRIVWTEDGNLGLEEVSELSDDGPSEASQGDTSGWMGASFRIRADISSCLISQAIVEGKTESDLLSKLIRIYHLRRSQDLV